MHKISNSDFDPLIFGETFRKLRKSKGLTQLQVSGKLSTVSLSQFENGKTIPHINTFLYFLNNINVSASEFQFMYDSNMAEVLTNYFEGEINSAFTKNSTSELKMILHKVQKLRESNPDLVRYHLEEIRILALLSRIEPTDILEIDLHFLKEYFSKLKEWGRYEIRLLGQSIHLFDGFAILKLGNKLIAPTQKLQQFKELHKDIFLTILSLVSRLIDLGLYSLGTQFINFLHYLNMDESLLFEKVILKYYDALLKYLNGDMKSLELIHRYKEDLIFYNCFETVDLISNEINKLNITQQ